jgi:DNA-binding MarR family transcriptional regulator
VQNGYELQFKSLVELSQHLNVSYRNLTRILKEFKEEKLIEKRKNSIIALRKDIILEMTLDI